MNLHNEIMNIQIDEKETKARFLGEEWEFKAYKLGHRDARHAAAELSLKADARIEELSKTEATYNAVISYMLGKGYCEEPLEFLRCWYEGDFDALREEWPDAPEEIYFADPLYKGKK